MSRSDDLRELAELVETGSNAPGLSLYDALPGCVLSAVKSYHGSLDACAAVHKAMLGERWRVRMDIGRRNRCWLIAEDNFKLDVYAETPARAWLAAILRALAAESTE